MKALEKIVEKTNLKSVVVVLAICGSLGVAIVDANQRNAFMTIAVTATGGFFGAEVPSAIRRRQTTEEDTGDSRTIIKTDEVK